MRGGGGGDERKTAAEMFFYKINYIVVEIITLLYYTTSAVRWTVFRREQHTPGRSSYAADHILSNLYWAGTTVKFSTGESRRGRRDPSVNAFYFISPPSFLKIVIILE